ncbi:MAG TPA: UDP-N-acetylmuramoyl-L-alanine--D-glutamate ligase [Patescibacteria group bacterium]|nr:UDP-N-acetylmuramoyl-L-alanine--D-glutamate ligase [Patescibacteria group bacterium]
MIYPDSKIAILGFGLEGRDVLDYFLKHGVKNITILDTKNKNELDFSGFNLKYINLVTGEKYLSNLDRFDFIFRSPGVYRFLSELVSAEKNGVVITSAVKYFLENCPATTIGVTGTKGKGTTSTLIYQILQQAQGRSPETSRQKIFLVGNIGVPPLKILDKLDKQSVVVLELSSFQLIDIEKSPNISVVLNITSDHMDWHKNQKEYLDSKKNILQFQSESDFAVINSDYPVPKSFEKIGNSKKYFYSTKKKLKGVYIENDVIFSNVFGKTNIIGSTDKLILRGRHNQENITAAICASILAGSSVSNVKKSVYSFKGLEHRLEFVRNVNGVSFYDDSFSTNPQTVEAAVKSFDEPVSLILGGFDKKLDYNMLFKLIATRKNIQNIVIIGDMRIVFSKLLKKYKYSGNTIDLGYSGMNEIVRKAYRLTPKGGAVVLSPGCSSFDMFENYKDRGDKFKLYVRKLK